MLLDNYFELYAGLEGPAYNWTWNWPKGSWTYEDVQRYGGDCSRTIDVAMVKLGLSDPGNTIGIGESLTCVQPYPAGSVPPFFLRGTVLLNDDAGAFGQDHSHVAMVSEADPQNFKQRVAHCRVPDGVHMSEDIGWVNAAANFEVHGFFPELGVDLDPHYWPGWYAHPALIAIYFATLARDSFQLPERLPVMCSMQELYGMWEPGPLPSCDIPGYWYAVNPDPSGGFYDSYGAFQQRPSQGWGTVDQVRDMDYALRAFCQEAVNQWRDVDPDDPAALTEWIADVQRPRWDLRGEYAKWFGYADYLIELGRSLIPYEYLPSPSWIEIEEAGWLQAQDSSSGWFGIDREGWVRFLGDYSGGWIGMDERGYLRRKNQASGWFGIGGDGYLRLFGNYSNGWIEVGEGGYLRRREGPSGWIEINQNRWLRFRAGS